MKPLLVFLLSLFSTSLAQSCLPNQCLSAGVCVNSAKTTCGSNGATCVNCNIAVKSVPTANRICTGSGTCTYTGSCNPGYGDCDGNTANGCEVNLNTNAKNCGSCNNICSAPLHGSAKCTGGICGFVCNTGYTLCNGRCLVFTSDVSNCGSCGNVCPTPSGQTATCISSVCGAGCPDNGDFETGDLTGWSGTGATQVISAASIGETAYPPVSGSYMAQVTVSSFGSSSDPSAQLVQTVNLQKLHKVTGSVAFLCEGGDTDDIGTLTICGATVFSSSCGSVGGPGGSTGWKMFSYTAQLAHPSCDIKAVTTGGGLLLLDHVLLPTC